MKREIAVFFSLLTLCLSACGAGPAEPDDVIGKVYVITPRENSEEFIPYLASMVKGYGMVPNMGSAMDDKGNSLHVLDATNSSTRLRSENVLLSGHENPVQCGVYNEPHSDPGQYFISVSPSTKRTDPQESHEILKKIVEDLKVDGYTVRKRSVICSEKSKANSK